MFSIEDFLKRLAQSPTYETLISLTKSELWALNRHYELGAKQSMRKAEIAKLLVEHFVDEDILPAEVLKQSLIETSDPTSEMELKKYELDLKFQMLEREKERELRIKELEKEEKEREKELRIKELEIEKEKERERLEIEKELKAMEVKKEIEIQRLKVEAEKEAKTLAATKFKLSEQRNLLPPFREKDVDKFFNQFEKIANNLKWPVEHWTTLIQCVLTGKAQEVYASLTYAQSADYEHVKKCILLAYELVPEAYRLKFRRFKKFDNQTYVELLERKKFCLIDGVRQNSLMILRSCVNFS